MVITTPRTMVFIECVFQPVLYLIYGDCSELIVKLVRNINSREIFSILLLQMQVKRAYSYKDIYSDKGYCST